MKVVSSKWAPLAAILPAAILAIALSGAGRADDNGAPTFSGRYLRAKIQYCTDCHGASGQGYRGYYPIPRLAGQTTEYFEGQLRAFVERSRGTNLAVRMSEVHGVSPSMRMPLAEHFRDLNPKPFGKAPKGLVATGKQIYEVGVPEANLVACAACHGPEAKGEGPNPRLAGQLYPYTLKVLRNWSRERGQNRSAQDLSSVMTPIVQNMTKSQMSAVAAYLSHLK